MKNKIQNITILLFFLLIFISIFILSFNKNNSIKASIRTINVQESYLNYEGILNDFDDVSLSSDDGSVSFSATKTLDLRLYDYVSYSSYSNDVSVSYNFIYNFELNQVEITVSVEDEEGNTQTDTLIGDVFLNDEGKEDAFIDIDGEYILLSEMKNISSIEECGWFKRVCKSVLKVASVTAVGVLGAAIIVGTAGSGALAVIAISGGLTCAVSTTQTVRANINYYNNKKLGLHSDVNNEGYITNQYLYNDWNFGFAKLDEVGCEVISIYNLLISRGSKKKLYDIIYDMEMLNIDYDIGFGYLGSNPYQIYRILEKYNIKYTMYVSLSYLQDGIDGKDKSYIIFSSKNNYTKAGIHSLHTFEVKKNYNNYYCYNGYDKNKGNTYDKLDYFIEYDFYCAYVIE